MQNRGQCVVRKRLEHDMDMVRHNAPGKQPIPSAVKTIYGVTNDLGDHGSTQETFSCPGVQIFFYLPCIQLHESFSFSPSDFPARPCCGQQNIVASKYDFSQNALW